MNKAAMVVDIENATFAEVLEAIENPSLDSRELYYRWEGEQWEATVVDLARDASDWAVVEADGRQALSAALACAWPQGERLGDLLVPFVDSVDSEEDQVFLTSQLVDQARGLVFAERLRTEVGIALEPPAHLDLLFESIQARADDVRVERAEAEALYEGLLLHNVVYEGVIVATLIGVAGAYLERTSLLPGLRAGLIAFARDLTRHVLFGVQVVQRGVEKDRGANAGAIEEVMEKALPFIKSTFSGSNESPSSLTEDVDVSSRALETFARRMHDVGLDMPT